MYAFLKHHQSTETLDTFKRSGFETTLYNTCPIPVHALSFATPFLTFVMFLVSMLLLVADAQIPSGHLVPMNLDWLVFFAEYFRFSTFEKDDWKTDLEHSCNVSLISKWIDTNIDCS